jgi:hypothetical protein
VTKCPNYLEKHIYQYLKENFGGAKIAENKPKFYGKCWELAGLTVTSGLISIEDTLIDLARPPARSSEINCSKWLNRPASIAFSLVVQLELVEVLKAERKN